MKHYATLKKNEGHLQKICLVISRKYVSFKQQQKHNQGAEQYSMLFF